MKQIKWKNVFLTIGIAMFVVLLLNSNTIFAAINTSYYVPDSVTDESLDEAFEDSTILGIIARLIYVVGRFLEWILGTVFTMLTGTSDFPWADKIVFNAVPLLDVNFINPHNASFVGDPNIQDVLKNTYATIFSLAVAFFGIVVLITAIKLVISTIASDKAKYKQAIVDWVIGFVMLFCMHYAISFIFYLNEQLVIVAANIVSENLENADGELVKASTATVVQELIDNVRATGATYNGKDVATIFEENKDVIVAWQSKLKWGDKTYGLTEGIMKDVGFLNADWLKGKKEQYERLGMLVQWASDSKITVDRLKEIKKNIKVYVHPGEQLITSQAIRTADFDDIFDKDKWSSDVRKCLQIKQTYEAFQAEKIPNGMNSEVYSLYVYGTNGSTYDDYINTTLGIANMGHNDKDYTSISSEKGKWYFDIENKTYHKYDGKNVKKHYALSIGAGELGVATVDQGIETNYTWTKVIDDLIILKQASGEGISGSNGREGGLKILSDLAEYFRYNSYNKELKKVNATGIKNGKNARIQNMIMYAILVGQSLILFILYVKRLFYVILLAMMAPIVVVFDFFQRFGK